MSALGTLVTSLVKEEHLVKGTVGVLGGNEGPQIGQFPPLPPDGGRMSENELTKIFQVKSFYV